MLKNNEIKKQKNLAIQRDARRELRIQGTSAEATLWKSLKGKQIEETRWRRQFSIGSYILDFYCPALRLCIELDGNHHFTIEGDLHDTRRDNWLWKEHGIQTLRFENKEVFYCHDSVIENIKSVILELKKTNKTHSSGLKATSPSLGEEL
ncbi:MAG: DUF559 domain-containing protein [Bacteroidaceae bacterium]|nr:DUF559 domain-containing protein [Bacteroidaceae bacterium]